MTLGALAGLVISTITGIMLEKQKGKVEDGLYGYNGVLVGIAVVFFFGWTPLSTGLLAVGAVLSSVIQWSMLQRGMRSYTAPFVVATWLIYFAGTALHASAASHKAWLSLIPDLPLLAPFTGVGQIMFQGTALSGLLFVVGVACSCGTRSLWLLVGAALGAAFGLSFGQAASAVDAGLFGFNAALTVFVLMSANRHAWRSVGGALTAVLFTMGFSALGWPALTAPFVLSTWLFSIERKVQH
jgi:urea transporter